MCIKKWNNLRVLKAKKSAGLQSIYSKPDDELPTFNGRAKTDDTGLILGVHGHASAWFGTIGGGAHPYNDIQAAEQLDLVSTTAPVS